jgi:DNA-binding beta-propeller fold protein YncE
VPRPSSVLGAAVTALALAVTPLSPLAADQRPDTLSLAPVTSPEGISAGPGTTFFVGDREGGDVYVGDARGGSLRTLVEGRAGAVAVGLLYDPATKRVWVAGGDTGTITAYDARTGEQLFRAQTGGGFLNDVAITRDAVYVTDSTTGRLFVVPLGKGARLPADGTFEVLPVTGDYRQPGGFGLNGIRVLPGGDLLAVSGAANGNALYVIDPDTGVADAVEVRGEQLTGGDGLVLRGSTLYVVRGFGRESVVQLRLQPQRGTATVIGELVDDDFDVPTTAALVAGDLYVVNGQFDDPGTPTEVVRVNRS